VAALAAGRRTGGPAVSLDRLDLLDHPRPGRRVRPPRGGAVPPGVGGRRVDPT
jgi:hypothetical protein